MTDSPPEHPRDNPLQKNPPSRSASALSPAGPGQAGPGQGGSVRASDADRDRVADILRDALAEGRLDTAEHSERIDAVYAAKTLGELEPLVGDLPQAGPDRRESGPAHVPYASSPARHHGPGGEDGTGWKGEGWEGEGWKDNLVAIFSGSVRTGRFRVPHKINAFALFGGVEIDLTDAVFEHRRLQINATAIFGGIDIKVPENVTLRQLGAGIFGGFDVHTMEAPEPSAPVVLIEGAAIFGGVHARPKRGKRLRDMRRESRREMGADVRGDRRGGWREEL